MGVSAADSRASVLSRALRFRSKEDRVSVRIVRLGYDIFSLSIDELATQSHPHCLQIVLVEFEDAFQAVASAVPSHENWHINTHR